MKHNLGLNRVNFRILGWHKAMVLSQTRQRSDRRHQILRKGEFGRTPKLTAHQKREAVERFKAGEA